MYEELPSPLREIPPPKSTGNTGNTQGAKTESTPAKNAKNKIIGRM